MAQVFRKAQHDFELGGYRIPKARQHAIGSPLSAASSFAPPLAAALKAASLFAEALLVSGMDV